MEACRVPMPKAGTACGQGAACVVALPVIPLAAPPHQVEREHTFLDAAARGDFVSVRAFVHQTPDVINAQPENRPSALHHAAAAADTEMCRWLLARGASPAMPCADGRTALVWAGDAETKAALRAAAEQLQAAAETAAVVGEDPTGEDPIGEDPIGEDPTGEDPIGEDPTGEDPIGASPSEWAEMCSLRASVLARKRWRLVRLAIRATASGGGGVSALADAVDAPLDYVERVALQRAIRAPIAPAAWVGGRDRRAARAPWTWKGLAGRAEGGDGYQFGDVARGLLKGVAGHVLDATGRMHAMQASMPRHSAMYPSPSAGSAEESGLLGVGRAAVGLGGVGGAGGRLFEANTFEPVYHA